jgi:hypothetical protein
MTKFWMTMMVAILALGAMTTGCPDGDNSCRETYLCDTCGNEFCGEAEHESGSCPGDCGSGLSWCGDGACDITMGHENCTSCPADCDFCGGGDAGWCTPEICTSNCIADGFVGGECIADNMFCECFYSLPDADADSDADATEDDTDTSEADANCPSVAGNWTLTYRENESGMESHHPLTLEQDGCLVIGWDDSSCECTGTISSSGYVSLYRDCYSRDRTVTGNFTQPPPRMEGNWNIEESPPIHGTWWADPR